MPASHETRSVDTADPGMLAGIDFIEAQVLWDNPDFIEITVKTVDEPRFMVIGKISKKHWSGIITYLIVILQLKFELTNGNYLLYSKRIHKP